MIKRETNTTLCAETTANGKPTSYEILFVDPCGPGEESPGFSPFRGRSVRYAAAEAGQVTSDERRRDSCRRRDALELVRVAACVDGAKATIALCGPCLARESGAWRFRWRLVERGEVNLDSYRIEVV